MKLTAHLAFFCTRQIALVSKRATDQVHLLLVTGKNDSAARLFHSIHGWLWTLRLAGSDVDTKKKGEPRNDNAASPHEVGTSTCRSDTLFSRNMKNTRLTPWNCISLTLPLPRHIHVPTDPLLRATKVFSFPFVLKLEGGHLPNIGWMCTLQVQEWLDGDFLELKT